MEVLDLTAGTGLIYNVMQGITQRAAWYDALISAPTNCPTIPR